jgi:hypothetical protein
LGPRFVPAMARRVPPVVLAATVPPMAKVAFEILGRATLDRGTAFA